MSKFPSDLDTDADIPMVTNNVTEIGAEAINAIREAIFAIEATLGADVQGSAPSLTDRLNAVLNSDGTFKAAALVAAGLIALPITDSMVASSAAIKESKLDLDHATQALYNAIISNDIDILALQNNATAILSNFLAHVSGSGFRHDGYQILLDTDYPTSTPPDILPLTSISIGDAIFAIKERYFDHIGATKSSAHLAANIALNTGTLTRISSNNLQGAIEEVESLNEDLFIDHRDDLHASGFSNFANSRDGYGLNRQFLPAQHGSSVTAYVLLDRQTIQFDGYTLGALGVSPGDVVWISDPPEAIGSYTIDGVGPRLSIGALPALTSNQLAVAENILYDGYVSAAIFSPSSASTLKGNMAPTIHQSDIRTDSIQVSRPNAAKVLSLGINPRFIASGHSLGIEVGVGPGLSRSISISDLNYTRYAAPAQYVTIDSIVERINHVLQNRADGNAFPAAAYRVGDELLVSHNWCGSDDHYLKITSSGSTAQSLYILGLDGYGANVVDVDIRPTHTANYYVGGVSLHDVSSILTTSANITAQIFTFPNGENPLDLGVKVGHLLHLKSHPNTNERGTYFVTGVDASSITIHKNSGISTATGVEIEVLHDAIPIDEIQGYAKHALIETYYDSEGKGGFRLRADNSLVTNVTDKVRIVDVSDNFASGASTIDVSAAGTGRRLTFANGFYEEIPYDFSGTLHSETHQITRPPP